MVVWEDLRKEEAHGVNFAETLGLSLCIVISIFSFLCVFNKFNHII